MSAVTAGRPRWERLLLVPGGVLLLILVNSSLNRQELTPAVAFALVAGLVAVACDSWLARGAFCPQPEVDDVSPARRSTRWPILAAAIAAAVGAWAWSGDNTFRAIGVASWGLSILAWIAAWWPGKPHWPVFARRRIAITRRDLVVVAALVAAVVIGAFFRLHAIGETPLDPTSDHAEKLLDVTDVLNGTHPVFFERNTGREPMQFYLTAGLVRTFDLPVSFTTLKIGTALIGTLAIPFVYLLAAELAGRLTGLIAANLFAVATWPVEISRAGLRFPYAVVASAATMWLLLRWMRTRDRRDALLCGLAIGIGLYGYTPFRVVVLAVAIGIALTVVTSEGVPARRRVAGDGFLIGATAAVVFVPLGRYALEHRDMFWSRASGRMTQGDTGEGAFAALFHQMPTFLDNSWNAALGFNWRGDSTWVNAVRFAPMLDLVSGALLLAGVATIVTQIAIRRDGRAAFIVAMIPVLMLSSTLALAFPHENPSVNRAGPVAPVIFTIAALPLAVATRRLREGLGERRGSILAVPAVAMLIAVVATLSFDQYFHDFDRQTRATVPNTSEIATAIRGAAVVGVTPADAFIIDWPNWLDIRNIGIALDDISWGPAHNVRVGEPLPEQPPSRPLLLILNPIDAERLSEVEAAYPNGHVTRYPSEVPAHAFMVVWVPPPASE